jgi:hypothetical protein
MIKNRFLFFAASTLALFTAERTMAQQGVSMNASGTPAHPSAVLDLSSSSQGVLVPRMTATQRTLISSPATGLLVYQTDGTTGFYFYDGAVWQSLNAYATVGGDLTGSLPNPSLTNTGVAAGTYGSTTEVGMFTVDAKGRVIGAGNTTISGVTPGGAAGGDLSGTYPNPSVAANSITTSKLANNSVTVPKIGATGTPSALSFLRGDGSWSVPSDVPGGAAGGDLAGTYPNPALAASGVTAGTYGSATEVPVYTVDAKGRVTAAGNTTITGVTPGGTAGGDLDGTYPNPALAASGVTAGTYGSATQVPVYTVDAKGRVTAAGNTTIIGTTPGGAAGGDLTGTFPNPTVANNAVTSAKILDGTVANSDISNTAAIAYSKLNLSGSVGVADHSATGTASGTTFLRGDNTWATPSSAPTGAAGGDLAGTYPNPALATSGVTAGTYGSATQVPAYTVDAKGRVTAASNITISGTTPGGAAGGDLTGTFPNPTVANSAVTSAKILDGTVANSDISATAAIAYSKLSLTGSVLPADMNATGTPSATTFLRGDGTWATAGGGGAPTGPAGGSLAGTYPNPTLATGSVGIAEHSATGTASATTFLRGDNTWATPSLGTGGTLNYLTKWTTAGTAIGNSQIQDNGTGLSVGAATPSTLNQLYIYRQQLTATGDGQHTTYSYRTRNSQNDGTGYSLTTSNSGLGAHNFWGDVYTFGLAATNYNDYSRTGGLLGADVNGSYWGSLGYRSSALVNYGIYGSSGYASGSGFAPSAEDAGIGGGFFGMVGSVSKGNVIGQLNSGELFASYNMGDVYTSGKNIELMNVGDEVIPAYASTSPNPTAYDKGTAQMSEGEVRISFDANYAKMLGEAPAVTITPMGQCNGVYIVSVDKTGFTVKELNDGHSNAQISWIAVGNRADVDSKKVPEFITKPSFNTNLSKVMFNDADRKHSGEGMWWDGTTLQFNKNYPASINPSREEKTRRMQVEAASQKN